MAGQGTSATDKQTPGKPRRIGDGTPGPGRKKGVPNKTTTQLKEALLEAATKAGGEAGLVGYLQTQATANPQSFLPLLGKVLPLQLAGTGADGAIVHRIELIGVRP